MDSICMKTVLLVKIIDYGKINSVKALLLDKWLSPTSRGKKGYTE